MKATSRNAILFVTVLALFTFLLGVAPALAEEEGRAGDEAKTATSLVPKEGHQKIPAGWMVVQGRYGATTTGMKGTFTFDQVPETTDADDTSPFTTSVGWMQAAGLDFLFFPTSGRRFMLSVSGEHQTGTFALKFDEEEYAYEIGLDSKLVDYYLSDLLLGIGYRWLRGSRHQHAASLYFKFGGGGSSMAIDGFANSMGGTGVVDVGTFYMYRFDNRMHMGIQFDVRGYGSVFPKIKINDGDNEIDARFGSVMGVLSAVIGWETL